jgi:hypothetical protein
VHAPHYRNVWSLTGFCVGLLLGAVVVALPSKSSAFALTSSWHRRSQPRETVDRFSACRAPRPLFGAYGWPVKPFDRPHPVRGNFGDPRTEFFGTLRGGQGAPGAFRFHNGIDISARDGAAVYPVVSGRVVDVAGDYIAIATYDHRHFQYWHISPVVIQNATVEAGKTILGHILPRLGHVHLTEIDGTHVVNPLLPGHLFPYQDLKPPRVDSLIVTHGRGRTLPGPTVADVISISAAAHDLPSIAPPGAWHDAIVSPAEVSWWLAALGGSIVRGPTIAFDVRHTLPARRAFWRLYAPGTFQNFPVSAGHHLTITGNYVFHITELDTESLPNGLYLLTVKATDICGNGSTLSAPIQIANTRDDRASHS